MQIFSSKTEDYSYKTEVLLEKDCKHPPQNPSKDKLEKRALSEEWDIVRSKERVPIGADGQFWLSELAKLKDQGKIELWAYLAWQEDLATGRAEVDEMREVVERLSDESWL